MASSEKDYMSGMDEDSGHQTSVLAQGVLWHCSVQLRVGVFESSSFEGNAVLEA